MAKNRVSILDEAVQNIEDYILSGEVKIGDKMLTEMELGERLNIGRSTVREALKMIQTMGYLETRPGKGNFIVNTTKRSIREHAVDWFVQNECEIHELLEFRKFLEPYVTRLATQRMTDEEVRTLGEAMESFEKAYHANDLRTLNKSEKKFHFTIVKGCHNNVFMSIYDSLMTFLNEYFAMSFSIQETTEQSLRPHQRIYDAIKERDPEKAKDEMRAHIELTIENMAAVVNRKKKEVAHE
ncbi:MAG: FadR family transcriptional regulator [Eubacteriales bacterium]|nr:FadR family transcriptional regulator [Eubacteriales bacterium]